MRGGWNPPLIGGGSGGPPPGNFLKIYVSENARAKHGVQNFECQCFLGFSEK